jgi:hypothetical protein
MCEEIENLIPKYNVDILYEDDKCIYDSMNTIVLYASRGCVNHCGYCAVPRLEGEMKSYRTIKHILESAKEEMPDAKSIVLYDNNFTEHEYFDNIVDELIEFGLPVDIHGLHVDSFTKHHAKRFAELKWQAQSETGTAYLRFSFDKLKYAANVQQALQYVSDANVKAAFFCYMLFNWIDSPKDFWLRIQIAQRIVDSVGKTIFLFPQRYEPFTSLKRNSYIGTKWTDETVRGLTKLYTYFGHGFIPITQSRNIYRYIGTTYDDFYNKINYIGSGKIVLEKS